MTLVTLASTRILGLDPGLRHTGWGVIEISGTRLYYIASGAITPSTEVAFSDRLLRIFEGVTSVLEAYAPHEAAIEESFLNTNAASTLKLGHARAAAMVPPARAGLLVSEYAAKVVKKAVVGTGTADKTQVAFMIRRLLPSSNATSADAVDALAVAITHAHARSRKAL